MWHPNFQFPPHLRDSSDEEKYDYFVHGFSLKHHMAEKVIDSIEKRFFSSREQLMAFVIGPTGVGKSFLARYFMAEFYKNIEDEYGYIRELPIVYVEANVLGGSTFSWKDFYEDILIATGEHESVRVYGKPRENAGDKGRKYSSRYRTEAEMKRDAINRLKEFNTMFLMIDELQHILKYGGQTGEKILDMLKTFASRANCRILGLGTYGVSFSAERSSELARRIFEIEFPAYSIEASKNLDGYKSQDLFFKAYMGLLAHVPKELDERLLTYVKDAFIGSCGCVGVLKEWCERALRRSIDVGRDFLSIDDFHLTRLKGSQLIQIAEDIREGKAFFAEPDDDEIWEALKPTEPTASPGSKRVEVERIKRRPGERKPARDSIRE